MYVCVEKENRTKSLFFEFEALSLSSFMKSLLSYLFLAFAALGYAQPAEPIACHQLHQSFKLYEPTEEELLLMENSNKRSDSIDILNYTIRLDISDYNSSAIKANTIVSFKTRMDKIPGITLDLKKLTIDSVFYNNAPIPFSHANDLLVVNFPQPLAYQEEAEVRVYYHGVPHKDPVWGGFYFVEDYIYNLGIGLSSTPPNFGKVWFPCFDNFVERTSYDYIVTTDRKRKAYCVGTFISEDTSQSGKLTRHYRMKDQIPTYLSSIAAANYAVDYSSHQGIEKNIPIELIAKPNDLAKMKTQFVNLPKAIDAFEYWFGKYRFERVGYVATTVGAMEHPTNVAYPISTVLSGTLNNNERLYGHEFGHHWWGDLTTLSDAKDMWIKEGNAEYSSHLFLEYLYGKDFFIRAVRTNLAEILKSAHINDGAYLPLSPMPYTNTYGTHTYRKGAAMIHNMRAVLGDSLYRRINHIIFDSLTGKSMDAYEYLQFMNANSGRDMTDYFNDYIFNKGYCAFFIDSFRTELSGADEFAVFSIFQKAYAADHLYSNVEVPVSFFNSKFEKFETKLLMNGSSQSYKIKMPSGFNPTLCLVNDDQKYNWASLGSKKMITKTGATDLPFNDITAINATLLQDSVFVSVVHHLVPPNEGTKASNIIKLSTKHFWQVATQSNGNYNLTGTLEYNGNQALSLDSDIIFNSEDSILLAYRKNYTEPWSQYPYYTQRILTATDKKGFMQLTKILPGEYCLSYGSKINVGTKQQNQNDISISPNPAQQIIRINSTIGINSYLVYDVYGRPIFSAKLDSPGLDIELNIEHLPAAHYFIQCFDKNNQFIAQQVFEKM